ncbi:sigma-70 family RNA polymerase sigma factor [Mesorhizobium sp. J428]|uniref:sigma-70 family RNA polymerase sigma factor n=1 Tax=Mesorhizobium sp. J428 TaxID=2898440 RepID=UPI002151A3BB|nr:sigma-70 family RNA polymerase sigma factor [Mesorhizobium sp. J428]MCR5859222.1 sigma-70 family RNA polymerase sigma factor [Mesorhizobium sp. J428]
MTAKNLLAARFAADRARLESVAYRMLGSRSEAEDAVQEVWLRLDRADPDTIGNISGWLTTVVARICLDMLRARRSRREESFEVLPGEAIEIDRSLSVPPASPEDEIAMADSVGLAMLAVLEALDPAERVAFVLHDMFAVPFEDIASVIGRSHDATRQLASRARRRVQGTKPDGEIDRARRREIVDAFIAASRGGDFSALLSLLAPDVVLRGDDAAIRLGGRPEVRGATAVAEFFNGRAATARPALVDGTVEVAVVPGGRLLFVLRLDIADGQIAGIEAIAEANSLAGLEVEILED